MDGDSRALHPAEPGHLAFCELMDGGGEFLFHLVIAQLPCQIEGDELVLQPVGYQALGRNTFVEEAPDFLYHSLLEAGVEPGVNAGVADLAADAGAYEIYPQAGAGFPGGAERLLGAEVVGLRYCVDIQACTSTENGKAAAGGNTFICSVEVLGKAVDVVLLSRLGHVYDMVRDSAVVREVLARAYVHPTVNLTGVGGDYLAERRACFRGCGCGEFTAELDRQLCLAGGGRPQDTDQVILIAEGVDVEVRESFCYHFLVCFGMD